MLIFFLDINLRLLDGSPESLVALWETDLDCTELTKW